MFFFSILGIFVSTLKAMHDRLSVIGKLAMRIDILFCAWSRHIFIINKKNRCGPMQCGEKERERERERERGWVECFNTPINEN